MYSSAVSKLALVEVACTVGGDAPLPGRPRMFRSVRVVLRLVEESVWRRSTCGPRAVVAPTLRNHVSRRRGTPVASLGSDQEPVKSLSSSGSAAQLVFVLASGRNLVSSSATFAA
jgi:hypothetical protein